MTTIPVSVCAVKRAATSVNSGPASATPTATTSCTASSVVRLTRISTPATATPVPGAPARIFAPMAVPPRATAVRTANAIPRPTVGTNANTGVLRSVTAVRPVPVIQNPRVWKPVPPTAARRVALITVTWIGTIAATTCSARLTGTTATSRGNCGARRSASVSV